MDADSFGATIANKINECVGDEIADENKPASGWNIRQMILYKAIPANEKLWLPKQYANWDEFLRSCDQKASNSLAEIKGFGTDPVNWKWGIYNTADFNHPLVAAPLIGGQFKARFTNVSGNGQTPNVGKNVSMRFIAKPAEWDETRHVIPLGQSGNPQSANWQDQFEFWRTGKPAIFPFTPAAVEKVTKQTILLRPEM
jgi:acyl-homoserine lactone acylase PvdQ